jgi:hypothetical protein
MSLKESSARFGGELIARVFLEQRFMNGKHIKIAEWVVEFKHCKKAKGGMLALLKNELELTLIRVETAVTTFIGVAIEISGRLVEAGG